MRLGEKLAHLRQVEGEARGLRRPLTKAEVVRLMRDELGMAVSQAYLSQLEHGQRVHLSAHTRGLLARFFGVHPGYLVDDPVEHEVRGYGGGAAVGDSTRTGPGGAGGSDHRLLRRVLTKLSDVEDPERYLALFERLLDLPAERIEAIARAQTRAALLEAAQRAAGAEPAAGR